MRHFPRHFARALTPPLLSQINLVSTLHVALRPGALTLTVYQLGALTPATLATLHLPVPGSDAPDRAPATAVGPEEEWWAFCAERPMALPAGDMLATGGWAWLRRALWPVSTAVSGWAAPARLRAPADPQAPAAPAGQPREGWRDVRCMRGAVRVRVQWVAPHDASEDPLASDLTRSRAEAHGAALPIISPVMPRALLPPRRPARAACLRLIGRPDARGEAARAGLLAFAGEEDFQRAVVGPHVTFDANDPRNAELLRLRRELALHHARGRMFRERSGEQQLAFGELWRGDGAAGAPLPPLRDLLLALRAHKPDMVPVRAVAASRRRGCCCCELSAAAAAAQDPIPATDAEIRADADLYLLLLAEYPTLASDAANAAEVVAGELSQQQDGEPESPRRRRQNMVRAPALGALRAVPA